MKLLMMLFTALLVACSSSKAPVETPKPVTQSPEHVDLTSITALNKCSPPWDCLNDDEAVLYEVLLGCPSSTKIISTIIDNKDGWKDGAAIPGNDGMSIQLVSRTNANGGKDEAVLYYSTKDTYNSLGPDMAMVKIEDKESMMLDFFATKALLDGEPDVEFALTIATGEYFCEIPLKPLE